MNHILYEVIGFHGNSDDYYNKENSYIDKVWDIKANLRYK